jgi:hypothetical protein
MSIWDSVGDNPGDSPENINGVIDGSVIPFETLITPLTAKVRGAGKWTAGDTAPPYYAFITDQTDATLVLGTPIIAELYFRDVNTGIVTRIGDVITANIAESVVEYKWTTDDLIEGVYDHAIKMVDFNGNTITFRGTSQITIAKEF